jgi:hypothetical protein
MVSENLNRPFKSDDISRCKIGFSDLEDSAKTRHQNTVRLAPFAMHNVQSACYPCTPGLSTVTIERWQTAVDQLITSNGLGTTL